MAQRPVTVTDILDGHVGLDLECFDRIYLNGWVHNLQLSGQVVNFLTHHLGFPIPSPAILEKIGLRFRKAVAEFARDNDIPVVRFAKGERKPPSCSGLVIRVVMRSVPPGAAGSRHLCRRPARPRL